MPCNAHNHPASCDCGWGGVWHGNVPYGGGGRRFQCDGEQDSSAPRAESIHKLVERGSPRSLTIPNAKCPVCGCRVFFYQNEYGSRVFFDDLGPPWPKHPCTDNSWHSSPASGKIVAADLQEEPSRRTVPVEEWRPCVIHPSKDPRLILKELDADKFVRLALSPEMLSSVFPVLYIREVSKRVLKLSYYHSGISSHRTISVEFEEVVRRNPAVKARGPLAIEQLPFDAALLTRVEALEFSVRTATALRPTHDRMIAIRNGVFAHTGHDELLRVTLAVKEEPAQILIKHFISPALPYNDFGTFRQVVEHADNYATIQINKHIDYLQTKAGKPIDLA
jgi:hypothetical protein